MLQLANETENWVYEQFIDLFFHNYFSEENIPGVSNPDHCTEICNEATDIISEKIVRVLKKNMP